MSNDILQQIDAVVKNNPVVLYMKGTPQFPMCGFSQRVAAILAQQGVEYTAVDVLKDPAVREGIKQYGHWPTIPQLYVAGELVGGCDIVTEMDHNGELTALLTPFKP